MIRPAHIVYALTAVAACACFASPPAMLTDANRHNRRTMQRKAPKKKRGR
jgi:hypothetical protein